MGKSIDSARVAPSGTTRARRGTLFAVKQNFWTAFSSLNPPLLHYSKNRWENKFLGLGDGRINESNNNVEREIRIIYITLKFLPSRPSRKTRRNKKKTHISENSTFSSYFYLSSGCCTTTFDGRLWVLFLFPILAEPALLAGRPFISSLDASSKDARKSASRSWSFLFLSKSTTTTTTTTTTNWKHGQPTRL